MKSLDLAGRVEHGWGADEALYVRHLTLGQGAVLNVAGLHLYYAGITGAGEIADQPVPEPPASLLLIAAAAALLGRFRLAGRRAPFFRRTFQ